MKQKLSLEEYLSGQGYISIQMDKNSVGHFVVNAAVNQRPVLLLADTGASNTVLDSQSAESLQLQTEDVAESGGGVGTSTARIKSAVAEILKIGDFRIDRFQLFVMDLGHVNQSIGARGSKRIDGVLGADILGSRGAIIDYGEAKLYLKAK